MSDSDIPSVAYQWITEEIIELLNAIDGTHIRKKRNTVIKIAFARASEQPLVKVFGQPDTCNESVWYMKWQHDPAIRAAHDACYKRAMEWTDEETARLESHYRRERLRSIARWAAQAPDALAAVMLDMDQRGSDRISAANSLMTWADPDAAGKAQPSPPAAGSQNDFSLNFFANMPADRLDQLIVNLEAAVPDDEESDGDQG